MSQDAAFRRALEEIRSRLPVEDVVREYVDHLVPKGNRVWACCPLHEEDTPSFAIGPDPGFWYCFGACSTGGDVFTFVQKRLGLGFGEAAALLASRCGVELPRSGARRDPDRDPGLTVLERAAEIYGEALRSREGRAAREYLAERGLDDLTVEAFGLGWAPHGGRTLVGRAGEGRGAELPLRLLVDTGLARVAERDGHAYDFFRGRLMIPIRDPQGRVVAFGGRVLPGVDGPKYVNTPETRWFHKGRLIYGYDRALEPVRRGGHLVLVEGYTDVMAAHQAGLPQVCAVLGTATTDEHARLVQRAGARRVSLVFDGDEAGRKAALKALAGLLPLEVELDVVRLPQGQDPADLLAGRDAQPFLACLEQASPWFDFLAEGLTGLHGYELLERVDETLALLTRLPSPVLVEDRLRALAARIDMPVDALREQMQRGGRRRGGARAGAEARGGVPTAVVDGPGGPGTDSPGPGAPGPDVPGPDAAPAPRPLEPRVRRACLNLVGASLVDVSLLPQVRSALENCPDAEVRAILGAMISIWDDEEQELDLTPAAVMDRLAGDPVRERVPTLIEEVRRAEDLLVLVRAELAFLAHRRWKLTLKRLEREIARTEELASAGDPDAQNELPILLQRLTEHLREPKEAVPVA